MRQGGNSIKWVSRYKEIKEWEIDGNSAHGTAYSEHGDIGIQSASKIDG